VPVLGIRLHRVAEPSGIALTDLPESARIPVRGGILAYEGLSAARTRVERLRARMLEPHPIPAPGDGIVPPGVTCRSTG